MNAKEYVDAMLKALRDDEYGDYFVLQASFSDDIENVSDEDWDKMCKCLEKVDWHKPEQNKTAIIIALEWFNE